MDVDLSCECGAVRGVVHGVTPASGNRVVCCCSDCQAFVNHLGKGEVTLDEFGGTEIYQTSQSQVKINEGIEHLRCLRLTRKGLVRWYTDCCSTPVGNTLGAGLPVVGLIHRFMKTGSTGEEVLGPVLAHVQCQHAIGTPDYPNPAPKFPLGITLRIARKLLVWKLRGMARPSVFFNSDGKPIVKPEVLV